MHTGTLAHARMHTHTCMHAYMHTGTHTHIYTHTHKHTQSHTRTHTHTHVHAHTPTLSAPPPHTHTHTHIHAYIHAGTHPSAHTHTIQEAVCCCVSGWRGEEAAAGWDQPTAGLPQTTEGGEQVNTVLNSHRNHKAYWGWVSGGEGVWRWGKRACPLPL